MLCDQDNDHMCNVVTFVLIASNTHHNQIYYSFRWIELSYQLPLEGFSHKTEICLLLTPGLTWLEYNVQFSGKTSNKYLTRPWIIGGLQFTVRIPSWQKMIALK